MWAPVHEAAARVSELRRLIAEKFPAPCQKPGGILPTGLAAIDAPEGGLRRAAVTEFSGASGDGSLFVHAMLHSICRENCLAALVDAGRTLDPESFASSALARLLVCTLRGCSAGGESIRPAAP